VKTHTKGSWNLQHREDFYQVLDAVNPDGLNVIATVHFHDDEESETLGNARLIAAAPELLAELEESSRLALELMERVERIDQLLAEAKGAQLDRELGEITRMRGQLGRNRAAIAKAKA
jgi:hypothetical protein